MIDDSFKNDSIKGKSLIWKSFCQRFKLQGKRRYFTAFALFVLFSLFVFVLVFLLKNPNVYLQKTRDRTEGIGVEKNPPDIGMPSPTSSPIFSSNNDCYMEWSPFSGNYWEGLRSKFFEANGVYTIPEKKTEFDNVAYYVRPCKGGIKAELKFISFAEKLINLNFYYGEQFRWEVGGNDLRSVKLYKNRNCTANWYGKEIDTEHRYLPTGEVILPGQPASVSLLAFLTPDGKLRTELHIKFTSLKSGEKTADDLFYYEFNVGSDCNSETVPNIDSDYQRIGVGLMHSSYQDAELPRVKFNEFRVGIYPEK